MRTTTLALFAFCLTLSFCKDLPAGVYSILSNEGTVLTDTGIWHPNKRGNKITAVATKEGVIGQDNQKWNVKPYPIDPNDEFPLDYTEYEIQIDGPKFGRSEMHVVQPYEYGYAQMERWMLTEKQPGNWQVKGYNSKCLQNDGPGMNISKSDCTGNENQLWSFFPL